MSPTKASLNPAPYEKVLTLRGVAYHLRELTIGELDDLQAKFTTKTATGAEDIDGRSLTRAMLTKCCTSPRLSIATLADLPAPVANKLLNVVSSMHFDELPEDTSEGTDDGDEEGAKGEG